MNPTIIIRSETNGEVSAITEVTVAAFKTLEISNHTEQFIIAALRAAKALTVSLVAEVDGRVIEIIRWKLSRTLQKPWRPARMPHLSSAWMIDRQSPSQPLALTSFRRDGGSNGNSPPNWGRGDASRRR